MIKDALLLTLFPACMIFAACYDLFTMTVPNRISLALVAGFLILAPLVGFSLEQVGMQLGFAVVALTLAFGCFAMGWIGGGDAKLFAATVLWMTPAALLQYFVVAGLLGGGLTLLILFYRQFALPIVLMQQGWATRLHDANEGVPYGIALAAAGLMAYAQTPFMIALGH
jgi:prepilin peptidase CpaA